MTTDPILQLVYGTRTLNLNDGSRYALEPGFTPPAALLSAQMSDGTSANRTGGATKIGQRAQNRQWSFSVQCLGSSERDVTRAFQDLAVFMSYAGIDRSVPLYLEYKPNSDINFKPVWGQDGWLRYEVRHANPPQIGDRYGSTDFRARNVTALIAIEVAPYAEGLPQRLCSASGGVGEDTLGTVDGLSRGLIVPIAASNLFTNPVFGNATWNTGWTAGASLLSASSNDGRFLLPGTTVSAKLTASASTLNTYLQDVTLSASQHAIWSVIKLPDGGTPASTTMQMAYNGSPLTTAFTSASNGFWYAVASATGTGGSASAGVVVKKNQTIYLAAVQAEKSTYRTPLCWGDLLGCSWSSTAHASTSTRPAGMAKVKTGDGILSGGQFTVRVIWRTGTAITTSGIVMDSRDASHANAFYIYLTAVPAFGVSFGLGSVAGGTVAANTTYILHAVWNGTTIDLYINGTALGGSALNNMTDHGAALFIGSDYTSANQCGGTFSGVTIFDQALTSTQAANDYANLSQLLLDSPRIEPVPWLWTKDGDNVTDNCTDLVDSTGAPHDNYCVIHGIPGSVAANTTIIGQIETLNMSTVKGVVLSLFDTDRPFSVRDLLYSDSDNTAADVTCSSGGHELVGSVSTTEVSKMFKSVSDAKMLKILSDRPLVGFLRAINAGDNLQLALSFQIGTELLKSPFAAVSLSSATEYRWLKTGEFRFSLKRELNAYPYAALAIGMRMYRTTGSANLTNDFFQILPRPLIIIGDGTQSDTVSIFVLSGHTAKTVSPAYELRDPLPTSGDNLELVPERYNYLFSLIGYGGVEPAIARTLTYISVLITPRWGLL